MSEFNIEISCGQIKFVKDFFEEYQDEKVSTSLKKAEKIKAVFQVNTSLSSKEAVKHVKNVFKESRYGSALHFSVQAIE